MLTLINCKELVCVFCVEAQLYFGTGWSTGQDVSEPFYSATEKHGEAKAQC